MTQRPFNIATDAVFTGVKSVDMVSACILFYRKRQRALKAIYLRPKLFETFRDWVIRNVGEKEYQGKQLQYDGVNIEIGSKFQTEQLIPEFYPEKANG
jgi:hypothetical protein